MIDIEITARDEAEVEWFIELLRNTPGIHPHDYGTAQGKHVLKLLCFRDLSNFHKKEY